MPEQDTSSDTPAPEKPPVVDIRPSDPPELPSRLGAGVPRVTPPAEVKEEKEPEVLYEEEKSQPGSPPWHDEATLTDQMANPKYKGSWKLLPPEADVFSLKKLDERKRLNVLLAKKFPTEAPSVIILDEERKFHAGSFVVYVLYQRVQYKRLAPVK